MTAAYFDLEAKPTLDEVMVVRRERMDRVAEHIMDIDADELDREVASPNGGTTTVKSCLHIVFREEWWHDHYANRDLAILERS
jgi:DinB superfamily